MGNNKPSKNYSTEFKREAVARSQTIGKSKLCKELGISAASLYRWAQEFSSDITTTTEPVDKPSYKDLEKEIRKLKKELGYVNEINRVLKKSTAIFSKSHLDGLK